VSILELIGFAIGCTLIVQGLTAIGAWALRRRASERLLLFFGIWCVLYGVRLVAQQRPVHLSIGGTARTWTYLIAFVTYTINVPGALFFEALIGTGWKQSVRRIWQLQAAYAVAAIAFDLASRRPFAAMPLNNPLVIFGLIVNAANVWMYRRRLSSLFTTPIVAGGAIVLLLIVVNQNLGRPLLPHTDLEPIGVLVFVIALAYGVVGSIVRGEAELVAVQRELTTARTIQRSLLPRNAPLIRGIDLAVQFIPMTAVAGDLYDFIELGPSRVGILVADVSGHGVPAALVASMVKLAFASQTEHAHDPGRVLTAMNQALARHLEHGFVTAVYAVIDTERRVVSVANAGHPPLLIGRSNRSVEEIHDHGFMLGLFPEATYSKVDVELREGDVILVYTDGVIEAQNAAGDFFDRDRVSSWLSSADQRDVARFSESAIADLSRWSGRQSFDDDVTLVVARFTTNR